MVFSRLSHILTVVLWQKRNILEIEKMKICSNVLFSMQNIMAWSKFVHLSWWLRKEELCDFLAKSQVFTKVGKLDITDLLGGTEKNQWPYQNRANLPISKLVSISKIAYKMYPLRSDTCKIHMINKTFFPRNMLSNLGSRIHLWTKTQLFFFEKNAPYLEIGVPRRG